MRTIRQSITFVAIFSCLTSLLPADQKPAAPRPNILLVVCDDLGYGDLACYGHPRIQSPNIDQLAREGLKLTSCYSAAPVCSPARAGLMTGRTPYRVGIHNWIPHGSPMHVRQQEVTIARLLARAGYATAQCGKWHLNGQFNQSSQPQPGNHGFSHWFATQNNALPTHHNPDNFVRNGAEAGLIEGYASHIVTDEAISWLENSWNQDQPFFLYVAYHEPHEPIDSAPRYKALYEAPEGSTLPNHHGNITQMDDAFGRLLKQIDTMNLREQTFVFFTSDNGPAITARHPHGSAGPLKWKKLHLYEGGIRVPGIVRYPPLTVAGTVSDVPISGVDVLPTFCALAGINVPEDRPLDGINILPVLKGENVDRPRPLYWQYNWAPSEPKVALRLGDWKLLARFENDPFERTNNIEPAQQAAIHNTRLSHFELYHLGQDLGETTDLSAVQPEKTAELAVRLKALHQEVITESPSWPAWTFEGVEGKRIREHYQLQKQKP